MGKPPVVLVHGFGTSARRTWESLGWIDLLREAGREVHAPDVLGHGSAPKPHEPAAYTELEGWLADRLPDGPIDAIGFSLGARLLLGVASEHPGRFRRLVVAGVGRNIIRGDPEYRRRVAEAVAAERPSEDPGMAYFGALAERPDMDRDALVALLEGFEADIEVSRLARIASPVLVVLGDRDRSGPPTELLAALPDAELRTLRGVDHFATPKSFDFLDAALNWLSEPGG
ncbi:MAG: alpha/beta fold hydrolase [Acidimicrobiia bacterium]|nr:alpha/beta fold hydrolase [Acidimicrobiia bacterium]